MSNYNISVVFISNFINHHQAPLADEFYSVIGNNYKFIVNESIPASFVKTGYPDFSDRPYLIKAYENDKQLAKAKKIANEADVVIIGSAPDFFITERLKQNKLTFRYSERWIKNVDYHLFSPRLIFKRLYYNTRYRNKNFYMLCASAYTCNDVSLYGAFPNKCYKWGYFTKVKTLEISKLLLKMREFEKIKILWCGRMLSCKRPEFAVLLGKHLRDQGYINFEINIIGEGEQFNKVKTMIKENNLFSYVHLSKFIPNEEVLKKMQESHIFLFTSNRQEGWGAVLNESMSNGCAVVASNEIGSVPFLIEDGKTGLIFNSKDINSLFNKVKKLIDNKSLREYISKNAYEQMKNMWSPKNAASNFLLLSKSLLNNEKIEISHGPCSKANKIKSKYIL